MPKVFSAEIMICATVYVVAADEEDAFQEIQALHMDGVEMPQGDIADGLEICGTRFDDPDLPGMSLSPAMTVYVQGLKGEPLTVKDVTEAG